jgi:hypothetical protein
MPSGQQTAVNSIPVVIASDQVAVPTNDANMAKVVAVPGAPAPSNASLVSGVDATGKARAMATTPGGTQRVLIDYGGTLNNWSLTTLTSLPTAGIAIKSGPGQLRGLYIFNNTGGTVQFLLFDRTTAPASGAAPDYSVGSVSTGAATLTSPAPGDAGLQFVNGIWLVLSSTALTYTPIASTNASFKVYWA